MVPNLQRSRSLKIHSQRKGEVKRQKIWHILVQNFDFFPYPFQVLFNYWPLTNFSSDFCGGPAPLALLPLDGQGLVHNVTELLQCVVHLILYEEAQAMAWASWHCVCVWPTRRSQQSVARWDPQPPSCQTSSRTTTCGQLPRSVTLSWSWWSPPTTPPGGARWLAPPPPSSLTCTNSMAWRNSTCWPPGPWRSDLMDSSLSSSSLTD